MPDRLFDEFPFDIFIFNKLRNKLARVSPDAGPGGRKPAIYGNSFHAWHYRPVKIEEILKAVELGRLEKELLLGFVMEKKREWLLSHVDELVDNKQADEFKNLVKRRKSGEPLAYITGIKEFYGKEFEVNKSVLIPRPSTESLIDLALDYIKEPRDEVRKADRGVVCFSEYLNKCLNGKKIVDIGTGSGCIAITLALELPDKNFIATDISSEALEVAERNAVKHGVGDRIEFRKGSLLEPVNDPGEPFIIVSNPPYIPGGEELMKDVKGFEPHGALFAGGDGMDVLNALVKEARGHGMCMGMVVECKYEQYVFVKNIII